MNQAIMNAWECRECEVEGRSTADTALRCWNCGGPVTVTARPLMRATSSHGHCKGTT